MKTSVLIVDNDRMVRENLAKALSDNYLAYKAFNGKDALKIIRSNNDIEIVLSDVMMPEMGGIELTEVLRSENRSLVIIVMTALSSEDIKEQALKKGADFFLPKPIDLNKLEVAIQTFLKIKKRAACHQGIPLDNA
jgi:CheY-like chemotaxis protein